MSAVMLATHNHPIGPGWSIVVDHQFDRWVDDGDVILWQAGRTIYASVYATDGADAEEAIGMMIEGRPGIPVQMFDRSEPALAGHAYLLPESCATDRRYWGLNTWTAVKGSVACVTIYFQHIDDLNWAIQVWKSVRPGGQIRVMN